MSMRERLHQEISSLVGVLTKQIEAHERLEELVKQKRRALVEGRTDAVMSLCRSEHEWVQVITELEKQRLKQVASLTQLVDPQAKVPMRLLGLAERLNEPHRGRLLVLRERLRERVASVQAETRVSRRATAALVRHMQGLANNVLSMGQQGAAYGRRGETAPPSGATMSTMSLTA